MSVSSRDFAQVYEDLGIDTGELGCIMLNTEVIPSSDIIQEVDYYFEDGHASGNVSEVEPHVTLLYGLLRSGPELKKHVDAVLSMWKVSELEIEKVDFFYSGDPEQKSITIIALIKVTDELKEGNGRLRMLPHIDTFIEYKPHITLAYVKDTSDWQSYVDKLNERLAGTTVKTIDLNYGD